LADARTGNPPTAADGITGLGTAAWQRHYGIGDGQPYASVAQLLDCTDWNGLVTSVIPGLNPAEPDNQPQQTG
jgi:hypothetical protein